MATSPLSRRELLTNGLAVTAAAGLGTTPRALADEPSYKSGKYRFRLSMAAYSYRAYLGGGADKATMTIEEFIDLCAKLELDAVELTSYYIYKSGKDYMHELKARAFRKGLTISGTSVGNNFCLPPGEALDKQLADLRTWVDNAVEMGAPHIRVFAGKPSGPDKRDQDFQHLVAALKQALEYAGSRGVFLGIENHGYLTENAEDVLKIVEAVPSPWLGINLDTGNFKVHGYEDIEKTVSKAVNCQIKTMINDGGSRKPADFARIFAILRKADYRGIVALEYEDKEDPKTGVPKIIDRLRELAAASG